MAEKLIIRNHMDLPINKALEFIGEIVKMGKISENGKSYCYGVRIGEVFISAKRNKKSHTFTVWEDRQRLEGGGE